MTDKSWWSVEPSSVYLRPETDIQIKLTCNGTIYEGFVWLQDTPFYHVVSPDIVFLNSGSDKLVTFKVRFNRVGKDIPLKLSGEIFTGRNTRESRYSLRSQNNKITVLKPFTYPLVGQVKSIPPGPWEVERGELLRKLDHALIHLLDETKDADPDSEQKSNQDSQREEIKPFSILWLSGIPWSGKSTLLRQWKRKEEKGSGDGKKYLPVMLNLAEASERDYPLTYSLTKQVMDTCRESGIDSTQLPPELLGDVSDYATNTLDTRRDSDFYLRLHNVITPRTLVLILDQVQYVKQQNKLNQVYDLLCAMAKRFLSKGRLPQAIIVVADSLPWQLRRSQARWSCSHLDNKVSSFTEYRLLSEEETLNLAFTPFPEIFPSHLRRQEWEKLVQRWWDITAGHPAILQAILFHTEQLYDSRLTWKPVSLQDTFVALNDTLAKIWQRYKDDLDLSSQDQQFCKHVSQKFDRQWELIGQPSLDCYSPIDAYPQGLTIGRSLTDKGVVSIQGNKCKLEIPALAWHLLRG